MSFGVPFWQRDCHARSSFGLTEILAVLSTMLYACYRGRSWCRTIHDNDVRRVVLLRTADAREISRALIAWMLWNALLTHRRGDRTTDKGLSRHNSHCRVDGFFLFFGVFFWKRGGLWSFGDFVVLLIPCITPFAVLLLFFMNFLGYPALLLFSLFGWSVLDSL